MKYAHYFATRTRRELVISDTPSLAGNAGVTVTVSGKAEARRIAREHGAQPWNF
jgi:ribosomal protein S3